MLGRVESIWDITCRLSAEIDEEPSVSEAHTILRVVHEAVVNSVRHGGSSEIRLDVTCDPSGAELRLSDDGAGFPFEGRFELDELREKRLGPVRLKQRVADSHGDLIIDTSSDGAILTVRLPTTVDSP